MSMGNEAEVNLLRLIFNATTWNDWAENDTTSPAANIQVALHTADPTDSGDQATSEVVYTGYARQGVARTTVGWEVTTSTSLVNPVAAITFPIASSTTSEEATFWSIGTTNDDVILGSGAISPAIFIAENVTPSLTTGTEITLT